MTLKIYAEHVKMFGKIIQDIGQEINAVMQLGINGDLIVPIWKNSSIGIARDAIVYMMKTLYVEMSIALGMKTLMIVLQIVLIMDAI